MGLFPHVCQKKKEKKEKRGLKNVCYRLLNVGLFNFTKENKKTNTDSSSNICAH